MPGSFDPYHKWLGISPKDQPPNHYRLLGIDFLESDPDVISSAADQRMSHVRAFQTGKHSALSQEILNEISAARICLLNVEKKAEYDRQQRELARADGHSGTADGSPEGPSSTPPLPPTMPTINENAPTLVADSSPRPWMRQKKLPWQALAGIVAGAVLLLGVILIVVLTGGDPPEVAQNDPEKQTNVEPDPVPGPEPEPADPPDPPDGNPEPNPPNDPPPDPVPPDPSPPDPPPPDPPPPDTTAQAVGMENNPTPEPQEKPPPPDAATVTAARERLKETTAGASAAELLQAAQAAGRTPEESFVLLDQAVESAVESGDVSTALTATDALLEQFEIEALKTKAELLDRLRATVTDAAAAQALAESGLALVDQAVAEGEKDLAIKAAEHTVGIANKSNDTALHRRAVLRFLSLKDSS